MIRATAASALEELRNVIGVLREDAEEGTQPPQPTLAQLPALLEESRAAGMTVRGQIDDSAIESMPDSLARTAYRVVQEGLTNARKHAPNAAVDLTIGGDAGTGLVVEVVSRRPVGVERDAESRLGRRRRWADRPRRAPRARRRRARSTAPTRTATS